MHLTLKCLMQWELLTDEVLPFAAVMPTRLATQLGQGDDDCGAYSAERAVCLLQANNHLHVIEPLVCLLTARNIIVPVNKRNQHWALLHVDMGNKAVSIMDSLVSPIFHLSASNSSIPAVNIHVSHTHFTTRIPRACRNQHEQQSFRRYRSCQPIPC